MSFLQIPVCFCTHLLVILVVQTLAHNSTATLSVIKDYLINKLQKQSRQIEQDEQRIQKYREETTKIRQEIEELKTRLDLRVSCLVIGCLVLHI